MRIELFVVPPGADEAFLADWRRERGDGTLYRALRDDVPLRYVGIAADGPYELVHDDRGFDTAAGILEVTPFDVPPDADERFVAAWHRLRDALAQQRGYLASRLYRAVTAADFRFIGLTRWSSPLMVARARRRPDVDAAMLPFRSHPALYQEAD